MYKGQRNIADLLQRNTIFCNIVTEILSLYDIDRNMLKKEEKYYIIKYVIDKINYI